MTKVTSFDKTNLKFIRNDIDAALKAVSEKYGMTLRLGNITFLNDSFSGKLEATLLNSSGQAVSQENLNLQKYGKMYLGDKFNPESVYTFRGERIKFDGIATRRSKYPVIYKSLSSGKRYKMDSDTAKSVVDPSYNPIF